MNSGGSAARMLCLDDYFMVEQEKKEVDPETGKKVTRKVCRFYSLSFFFFFFILLLSLLQSARTLFPNCRTYVLKIKER